MNHSIYARTHELDYRLECGLDRGITNKFFYKTSIIRRVLPLYDWIIWIDDDAYFTDFDRDNLNEFIDQAERGDHFMVIANGPTEPNGFWSRINTGVVIFRNDPRTENLLDLMESSDLVDVRAWWDEAEHGVFTNGDQDQMLWALETTGLMNGVRIVDHRELNSRGHYYDSSLDDAFVMHFCGHFDKQLGIVRFADRFNIGHELVPVELLDEFSVKTRSPMPHSEYLARAARMEVVGRSKKRLRPWYHRYKAWQQSRQDQAVAHTEASG
ncbi:hypothetical protein [Kocuria sp.]|uniref:hypothetical protein n=1 Tax=Kocuria sp. TaxID=1871328 RepID=UPI0034CD2495